MEVELIKQIAAAVFLCLGTGAICAWVRRRLTLPLRGGEDTRLCVTVQVRGDARELESALRAISCLRDQQGARFEVKITDLGLTPRARRRAELLCRRYGAGIIGPEDG